MSLSDNYKFLEIKSYCSTEWLANNTKKYRTVFDETEVSYVYCEFSFINKKFDIEDWGLLMQLKCKDSAGLEMCKWKKVKGMVTNGRCSLLR